jgi:hypothetical protein
MRRFEHKQRSYGSARWSRRPPKAGIMALRDGHMGATAAGSNKDDQFRAMKQDLGTKSSRLLLSKED